MRRIMAFDPSLTATGWALAELEESPLIERTIRIIEAGVVRAAKGKTAALRASAMAEAVGQIAMQKVAIEGGLIIVETPSHSVNKRRHGGGGAGLASYGMCVGQVVERLRGCGYEVATLRADQWAHGFGKEKSRRVALGHFAEYKQMKDAGADAADAIAMLAWWASRSQIRIKDGTQR